MEKIFDIFNLILFSRFQALIENTGPEFHAINHKYFKDKGPHSLKKICTHIRAWILSVSLSTMPMYLPSTK